MSSQSKVRVWTETVVIPTYLPAPPDRNPMFLEKRVYQGSSGKVYPLPFTDRIAETKTDRPWKAVWLENEYLRVMILPEIGGRIHALEDKTNGYDLIYRQPVIKPALVGLAGPWISGGIEFNWPQHHRPATFLPVDVAVEEHDDGSRTVWCSDHDPMTRMKGMHGVCLHPDKAYLELKVRAYNRTPFVQTFLWWANVATRVHEGYQSFFPPDVHYVADHAKRATSEYPLCQGHYYGVNYGERGRKGVPKCEVPSNFVPFHCREDDSPFTVHYSPNDLSFYANIPVPTSYMCMGSKEDFFGGYDHYAKAGLVHIADHHIAPGKKQWTWGNHEFGYAWDRNLTDPDATGEHAPYIELMAGVYTDNQPDFSFLQPGETKTWSQFWYPIQMIGPAQHANLKAALNLKVTGRKVQVGLCVTRNHRGAKLVLLAKNRLYRKTRLNLTPGKPFLWEMDLPARIKEHDLRLEVVASDGSEILSYSPKPRARSKVPPPATEPPAPADIASADELFVTGQHLTQYRHATRCPTAYWREALRRDPIDARSNNAMGLWHLRRGEFDIAEKHFRNAIERLTRRNPNPYDGEPYYNLGLCLRYRCDASPPLTLNPHRNPNLPNPSESKSRSTITIMSRWSPPSSASLENRGEGAQLFDEAYAAFYKATWNQAWAGSAYHALAEIDCCRQDWKKACEHAQRACQASAFNQRAMNLRTLALKKSGDVRYVETLLRHLRRRDPLDWWTRHLLGEELHCDLQTRLDIAHDYARAGFYEEAAELLSASPPIETGERASLSPRERAGVRGKEALAAATGSGSVPSPLPTQSWGVLPLVQYMLGWLHEKLGDAKFALRHYQQAAVLPPDYCFPARLEETAILEAAMRANPKDARAPYYLGNLLYDRRRHEEAVALWERSAKLDPKFAIPWRNLGIGYFNILKQPAKARAAYDRAFKANPNDARLLYERDQLWKRLGKRPARRLRELEKHPDLVRQRDDLSVELCALYNQTGQSPKALQVLSSRHFQPWEGGEGGPLGQWVRSHLALGRGVLATCTPSPALRAPSPPVGERDGVRGNHGATEAHEHFEAALTAPPNLGEAKHLLANQSDIHYWLGCAAEACGDPAKARRHWLNAATFKGDFQEMSVRAFSEMTYYSALSLEKVGRPAKARQLFQELLHYAQNLQRVKAKIDYFATSLPTMLLFEDDIQFRQETTALFLQAQAHLGLGSRRKAGQILAAVLKRDPNHALAADLLAEFAARR